MLTAMEMAPGDGKARSASPAVWLEPEGVLLDVEPRDRRHALELAAQEFARSHGVDSGPIFRALWRRELVGSTGIGRGVAIPHARIDGIDHPITLFMRTKWPIHFESPDSKDVNHILTILVPADGDQDEHLQLLAFVAEMFMDGAFRSRVAGALDETVLRIAFAERARDVARRLSGS
ncbi:MAG: PTS sugar transporter subunit IIA [Casimicrobiaceae bacterium]